jgi:hypothetical protein
MLWWKIFLSEDNFWFVDTGHADVGPFNSTLEASEHVCGMVAARAKHLGPSVYFLSAKTT